MTVWPTVPLPPRPVARRDTVLATSSDLRRIEPDRGPQVLPDEWVLRALAGADLDDDRAVEALLTEYGTIYGRYPYTWVPRDVAERLWGSDPYHEAARVGREDRLASEQAAGIEDARWWLKTARALAGSWARASRGEDPHDAWQAEGFLVEWFLEGVKEPARSSTWLMFTGALNEGLRPFHPRLRMAVDDEGQAILEAPRGWYVDLYSAACVQVFNFMVGECDAQRCENETCGRTFVHQQGGSRFGQHRTKGLRYCQPACASAQAARQYRRRKAARKEQS
jgi:hypothetical protein